MSMEMAERETCGENAMKQQGVQLTEILLDNALNISIIHPALLTNIRSASKKI